MEATKYHNVSTVSRVCVNGSHFTTLCPVTYTTTENLCHKRNGKVKCLHDN
jgi:hypothetical protein